MRTICLRWRAHEHPSRFRGGYCKPVSNSNRNCSWRYQAHRCTPTDQRITVARACHPMATEMPSKPLSNLKACSSKTVAVVGAGPAGLVSAKYLLDAGLRPFVFDKHSALGGLWSPSSSSWESLRTNLSRYTCSFSQWPWKPGAAMFPSKAEMGAYLQDFAKHFLQQEEEGAKEGATERARQGHTVLRLSTEVTRITAISDGSAKWLVEWRDEEGGEHHESFDHVVIASGFFSQPFLPVVPGLSSFSGPMLHSSAYRSPDLFSNMSVAVVGASFSAVEIAAEVALKATSMTHIVPSPCWLLPRHLPWDPTDPATPFVPLDWVLYRRSSRQKLAVDAQHNEPAGSGRHATLRSVEGQRAYSGEQQPRTRHAADGTAAGGVSADWRAAGGTAVGRSSVDLSAAGGSLQQWQLLNKWLKSVCGNQAVQGAAGLRPADDQPPRVAISDTYASLVQQGRIQVLPGRLQEVQGDTLLLADGSSLKGIDAVILCTGFRPSLPFFSEEIQSDLSFLPNDTFMPLLLHESVFHPRLTGLAFVGMYRGQYFAIAELQARWVAAAFSGSCPLPSNEQQQAGIEESARLRAQQPRPQFPHPDYIGLADRLAEELGLLPPADWMAEHDVVLPADYSGSQGAREAAAEDLKAALAKFEAGWAVAGMVFRGLQGDWNMWREIDSRLSSLPSGSVRGAASFTMHLPTSDEYLYAEEGRLTLLNTSRHHMNIQKQDVYKYLADKDRIDVHFAPGDATSKGFFHSVKILPRSGGDTQFGWRAEGDHLCAQDMYVTSYHFKFEGIRLVQFEIRHDVRGPDKDYTSTTVFTRPN